MAECQFIAFHGWGFDSRFWQPWKNNLSKYGSFQIYDRGYFHDPQPIEVKDSEDPLVLITHSYGLHWLSESLLQQANMLIITGGFLYFHPYAAQYKRRSRLVVQEMINELEIKPEAVLQDFYENCFAPEEAPIVDFEDMNHQLLLDDLQQLQQSELDAEALKIDGNVCILHGAKDRIVSHKKGRQIYNQLQEQSQYFEIKDAGHALPNTHFRQCIEFITPEINQLREVIT